MRCRGIEQPAMLYRVWHIQLEKQKHLKLCITTVTVQFWIVTQLLSHSSDTLLRNCCAPMCISLDVGRVQCCATIANPLRYIFGFVARQFKCIVAIWCFLVWTRLKPSHAVSKVMSSLLSIYAARLVALTLCISNIYAVLDNISPFLCLLYISSLPRH